MPVFLVERHYAEQLEVNAEEADRINAINDVEGVRWLYSFLSADLRKTFCLYEAPTVEHILRAAARAGIPADKIEEITGKVAPHGAVVGVG